MSTISKTINESLPCNTQYRTILRMRQPSSFVLHLLVFIVRRATQAVEFLRCVLLLLAAILTDVGVDEPRLFLRDVDTCPMEPVGAQVATNVESVEDKR